MSAQTQIAIKAKVLRAPVDAVYEKKADKEKQDINLDGSNVTFNVNESTFVIYGHPDNPESLTLTELFTELATMFTLGTVDAETIKGLLPDSIQAVMDSVGLTVRNIYWARTGDNLVLPSGATKEQKAALRTAKADPDSAYSVAQKKLNDAAAFNEYAFWIDFGLDEELLEGFPFQVDSVSFKLWSTDNDEVKKNMEIDKMQKLLAFAGEQTT